MTVMLWALLGAAVGFVISIGAGILARGPLVPTSDTIDTTAEPATSPVAGAQSVEEHGTQPGTQYDTEHGVQRVAVGVDDDHELVARPGGADRRRDLWCVLAGAVVFAGVGVNHSWLLVPLLPSLLVWAAIGDVDARTRLIPNRANAAAGGAAALVVAAGTYVVGWQLTYIALFSAVTMGALYFVLAMLPSGVGGGDLKLAPSIAAVCGSVAAPAPVAALVIAFVATAAYGIASALRARLNRTTAASMRIPHGPFMILGAVLAIATN